MKSIAYDLVIVGGGSGGYAAARTARDLGASVAIVDRGPLGGLCILRGCMPSKTLLATSDLLGEIRESPVLGITTGTPHLDMHHVIERKREVIEGFAAHRREGLGTFPLYDGDATFESPTRLRVGTDVVLEAPRFVIATGSVVSPPPVPGLIEAGFEDSDDVLDSERLPESAIVLGGGYVGAELGQFLARAGVKTTFLVRAPHLLSSEDSDVGEALTHYFRAEGIDVRTEARLSHVEVRDGSKHVHYHVGTERRIARAQEIFYALGRVPNVAGLGLENAGVAYHPISGIDVGLDLRTSNPNIFAVGDVNGIYPLVHVAIYQGEIAARNAVRDADEIADYRLQRVHTVFTDPQVATVGATEKSLRAEGKPYVVATYPFDDHGKAIAINKTKGFVKMIASESDGEILGASIVGAQASDLIAEIVVAMHYYATVADFIRIPHLHPTLAEIWTYPAEELAARIAAPAAERGAAAS